MRGYYLHYRDIGDANHEKTGIERKVEGQIKALNNAGCNCEFVLCRQPESVPSIVASCLPFFPDGIDWPDPASIKDADYLYIRRPRFASKQLLDFLDAVKESNPQVKIIYEVPTYPYDREMDSLKMLPAKRKDMKYRAHLSGFVDTMADLSGTPSIFEVPTTQIFNGIDLDRVKVRDVESSEDTLDLLFVAMFMDWHAADRVIGGLAEYKKQRVEKRVILHLVGGGEKIPFLKALARSLGVEREVIFHGYCNTAEMDALYDRCDVAIASLGFHRIGVEVASTLKTREYLAKGMPFVYSGKIDVFMKEPVDFCLEVPDDDSPVDIDEVVRFFHALQETESTQDLTARIRAYAEANVSMDAAMTNIVHFLKEGDRVCKIEEL